MCILLVWCRELIIEITRKAEAKAIYLSGLDRSFRRMRLPEFKTIDTWRWRGCQRKAQAAFSPRKYSWYSFLLEAESTPGS
jgi:hypothetical protein